MLVFAFYTSSLLLRIDAVQHWAGNYVSEQIHKIKNLPITIGSVRVRHLNKVELENVLLNDLNKDTLAYIEKLTVHLSPLQLLREQIKINTITLAKPTVMLKRETPESEINMQYLIDLFAGNDTTPAAKIPNLRANQLHIYDGRFSYDVMSVAKEGKRHFSPQHIDIKDITATISLKCLSSDTLSLYIRNITGREQSGLALKRVTLQANASPTKCTINNFKAETQRSSIRGNNIIASYTIKNSTRSIDDIRINGEFSSKGIYPKEFSSLASIADKIPSFNFLVKFNCTENSISAKGDMATHNGSIGVKASIAANKSGKEHGYDINIAECDINDEGINTISSLVGDSTRIRDILSPLGTISLTGEAKGIGKNISGNLAIETQSGNINATLNSDKIGNYNLCMTADKLNVASLTREEEFGTCNITLTTNGTFTDSNSFNGKFDTSIEAFSYKGYRYTPIKINGIFTEKQANATAYTNDSNLAATLKLKIDNSKEKPEYDVTVKVDSIIPYNLNLSDKKESGNISFMLEGNYIGKDINDARFTANLYDFRLHVHNKLWKIRHVHIANTPFDDQQLFTVESDILDCTVQGYYNFGTLPHSFNRIVSTYIPSFSTGTNENNQNNNFIFFAHISNSEIISRLLNLPVTIHETSQISGSCDDSNNLVNLQAELKETELQGRMYNLIKINAHGDNKSLVCDAGMTYHTDAKKSDDGEENDELTIELHSKATNDTIHNNIKWYNIATPINKGDVNLSVAFDKQQNGKPLITAQILPSEIIYCDSIWNLAESNIRSDENNISIHGFKISNRHKHLYIDGAIGEEKNDSLHITLSDISIQDLLDIANFHPVDFGGNATGKIEISQLAKNPRFKSNLDIKGFEFEHGYMGDMSFKGEWDERNKAIKLFGRIKDGDNTTIVDGFVSPANDTINLNIDADNTRIDFLNHMLRSFISDVDGYANGKICLRGGLKSINLYGALSTTGSLRLIPTNTKYSLKGDSIYFTRNRISFNNFHINDRKNNSGYINGGVNHKNLKNFTCQFDIKADNLLAYDTHSFGEDGFYGTAFVSGNATFTANDYGIRLNAEVDAEENSKFVYNAAGPESATDNKFITFVDRNASKKGGQNTSSFVPEKNNDDFISRLHLDFMINTTPGLQLRVYTNTITGDYIDIYGNGPINAVYDEKEGFSMKGSLNLTRGTYKFTLQEIFPKEFDIRQGSTLNFNGDPFLANLNLKTVYTVPSVPLTDLSITAERRKSVKVNCLMDITGTLMSPSLTFGVELPDGNEEERELLTSATSTPEQTNMQFIYLVAIGKFYTYNYNNQNTESQSSTVMESLISSTISGQLNNILSQITDNDNWNLSGNFSTSERGWNSMEVEGMLSGRLLNNRLLINSNFGYRDNPLANKNFIGDFEVQWLLNKSGNISLKAYNKTNDRYFSKTTLTTQGAGIMLKHDFNKWLFWRKDKKEDK